MGGIKVSNSSDCNVLIVEVEERWARDSSVEEDLVCLQGRSEHTMCGQKVPGIQSWAG